ncbi:MAG: hypothetical protein MUC87_17210 [Bacteroidia bacterium]|jgi:hypothetical protein|nr:hypothetical protein [Bacteroidia bacterium]
MKKIEFSLVVVALLSVSVLLSDHWSGTIFAPLGITLLALFYFMSGFFLFCGVSWSAVFRNFSYTRHSAQDLLFAAGGGILVALLLIGIQCKLLLWSHSNELLLFGLCLTAGFGLIALCISKILTRQLLKKVLLRVGIYAGIAVGIHSISASSLIAYYYRHDIEMAQVRLALWHDPYNSIFSNKLEMAASQHRENHSSAGSSDDNFNVVPR